MSQVRVTSQQVAQKAGVSQSAVSRVFTPGASASIKTIEKVQKAAAELGYRPNSLARAMVSGKSRIIGVVVAYLNNQFYPEALEKLSKQLQERGYHVLVFMTSNSSENIDTVIEEILDYQVDGIIAASVSLSPELSDKCRAAGVPLVLFNRAQEISNMSAVTSDNYAGGQKVAKYLISSGYKRISYLAGWEGASTQRDREAGFLNELNQAGIQLFSHGFGNFEMEQSSKATREMFSKNRDHRPEVVFVANDHMALAVMDTLRYELGFKIPEDVAVVGYDDVPAAAWPSYDLTTVRQCSGQMVSITIDILLEEIKNSNSRPRIVKIDGPLIIRSSTRNKPN
tara:strand:+ start:351 stop:1370 length:1020 start_codon:yes stop_codon:yes gene_type:complete